jgi:hypothetical protein
MLPMNMLNCMTCRPSSMPACASILAASCTPWPPIPDRISRST